MLTFALLFAAQIAPIAAPKPGPIKVFGAWVVACDNVRRCEMTSIWPEESLPDGSPYAATSVSIVREPGPAGDWSVDIELPDERRDPLRVTTARGLDVRGTPDKGLLRFAGKDAERIVAGMIDGAELRIGDETSVTGMVSLKGSSVALRFIDAQQGRTGTVSAAVAKGARPASVVPHAAALPRIAHVRPGGSVAPFTPAMRKALDKASGCAAAYEGMGDIPAVETFALGGGRTLVLLPCGSGAYNFSSQPYILTAGGKPALAKFDSPVGFSAAEDGKPTLVNASFDSQHGVLISAAKGRGLGDCGSTESFVWDGAVFRLVEATTMPECRGSTNWLTIWRTEPVAK